MRGLARRFQVRGADQAALADQIDHDEGFLRRGSGAGFQLLEIVGFFQQLCLKLFQCPADPILYARGQIICLGVFVNLGKESELFFQRPVFPRYGAGEIRLMIEVTYFER